MFSISHLGTENVFPFYGWNIFHTRPDKFLTRYFVYVNKIDGVEVNPPADVYDIQHRFKNVDMYTFANKVHTLGHVFDSPQAGPLIHMINENLVRNHQRVDWEFVQVKYEVIAYHLRREFIERKVMGQFFAVPPGVVQ